MQAPVFLPRNMPVYTAHPTPLSDQPMNAAITGFNAQQQQPQTSMHPNHLVMPHLSGGMAPPPGVHLYPGSYDPNWSSSSPFGTGAPGTPHNTQAHITNNNSDSFKQIGNEHAYYPYGHPSAQPYMYHTASSFHQHSYSAMQTLRPPHPINNGITNHMWNGAPPAMPTHMAQPHPNMYVPPHPGVGFSPMVVPPSVPVDTAHPPRPATDALKQVVPIAIPVTKPSISTDTNVLSMPVSPEPLFSSPPTPVGVAPPPHPHPMPLLAPILPSTSLSLPVANSVAAVGDEGGESVDSDDSSHDGTDGTGGGGGGGRKRPRKAHMMTDRQRRAKIKAGMDALKQILAQQVRTVDNRWRCLRIYVVSIFCV